MEPSSRPSRSAAPRSPRSHALLLAGATFAVYLNGLDGPFIFDDINAIVANPALRGAAPISEVLWP